MKIKLVRYHHIEGRRETDKGAVVEWNIIPDSDCLFIKTENTSYKLNYKIGDNQCQVNTTKEALTSEKK